MLVPAPYQVPEKMAKKKVTGTRKGLRRKAVIESSSGDDEEDYPTPPTTPKTGENMKRCLLPVLGRRRKGRPPFSSSSP